MGIIYFGSCFNKKARFVFLNGNDIKNWGYEAPSRTPKKSKELEKLNEEVLNSPKGEFEKINPLAPKNESTTKSADRAPNKSLTIPVTKGMTIGGLAFSKRVKNMFPEISWSTNVYFPDKAIVPVYKITIGHLLDNPQHNILTDNQEINFISEGGETRIVVQKVGTSEKNTPLPPELKNKGKNIIYPDTAQGEALYAYNEKDKNLAKTTKEGSLISPEEEEALFGNNL